MEEQASFHPLNKESIRRNNFIIEWETPEYHHIPKGNDWYWIVGIVATASAITSILFNNILFAIIIVLSAFIIMMYAARPAEDIIISVNSKGVRVKDRLYPFTNIKSFTTKEHWHGDVLILNINKIFLPIMVLPINDETVNTDILTQYLEAFIPEEDHSIPFAEALAENLGF